MITNLRASPKNHTSKLDVGKWFRNQCGRTLVPGIMHPNCKYYKNSKYSIICLYILLPINCLKVKLIINIIRVFRKLQLVQISFL